tara:strand:+ start:239 stop:454 length:216 start_codon:yes stop_codon:yes gene_type:complete
VVVLVEVKMHLKQLVVMEVLVVVEWVLMEQEVEEEQVIHLLLVQLKVLMVVQEMVLVMDLEQEVGVLLLWV